ncbi:MAG: phosphoadenylyl-sulfate reductase [Rhodospirillales bacterium]|nr:phosphoadenylyl-sulfate reductase [Rhodospirillales bacterium]
MDVARAATADFRIPNESAAEKAARLNQRYESLRAEELVAKMIEEELSGQIALLSSFGTGSAVLLHMVAGVDRTVPVLFLDTGKHFGETRRYRDQLVDLLGLTDVRTITPDPALIAKHDPRGVLWMEQPDRCCFFRKAEPLKRALGDFDAHFTGRRRQQSGMRAALPRVEADEDHIKINPLAGWSSKDVVDYFAAHELPRHPLEEDGFLSIGCMPCTDRVTPGENARAGRWRNNEKTECGVHFLGQTFKDFGADI